ncbi:transcription factor mef2A [Drosophila sechellia]|uniref:GM21277 n=1 Tax=Drosophila sechellia TaxID=7238 RepID=B4HNF2_DROSE|nr:transcription factor mef2A [Drosophila sechellia]EDW47388.1 GM21277 [Drosophila sechellia]
MMDEQLIDEVAQHGVIYNRQKYYLNGGANGGKYETKDEAWQLIAMKLRTDVDTCKKRWKYLRERYVSQRKQGDPPVYEHLSRPYLEKMKFLDQHIQPRKSYRHVPNFLTSPQSANSSGYNEYQVDKSNGSMKNVSQFGSSGQSHLYHQPDQQHAMTALSNVAASALENVNGQVKIEADQVFRDFAAAVASQQLQHISQSQMQQQAAAVAAVMADSSQGYQDQYKDGSVGMNGAQNSAGSLTSTSSSMKSPLSSPLQGIGAGTHHPQQQAQQQQQQQQQQQGQQQSPASDQQLPVVHSSSSATGASIGNSSTLQMQQSHVYNPKGDGLDSSSSSHFHMKKPRVQLNGNAHNQMTSNGSHFGNDSDDESDENSHDLIEPQVMMQQENHYSNSMPMQRGNGNGNNSSSNSGSNNPSGNNSHNNQQQQQHQNMFPSNTDFLFQLYQQFPHQASSSHPANFGKFQAPPNHPGVQRLSEHLLGELVTTELLKMNKERKKSAQKRILEILFFDD